MAYQGRLLTTCMTRSYASAFHGWDASQFSYYMTVCICKTGKRENNYNQHALLLVLLYTCMFNLYWTGKRFYCITILSS